MPNIRIPIVGSYTGRAVGPDVADTKDQRFTNCFPEVVQNPLSGKKSLVLSKRPGTIASSDVQASATADFGACVWRSNSDAVSPVVFSYTKSNGTDQMFFTSAGVQVGADITGAADCDFLTDTSISGTGNLTACLEDSGTSVKEVWFFPQGGAWTQITDSDFPSTGICPAHTHMDGFMFVMTTNGRIYNSDLNSLSSWTANNYLTANSITDGGVGVARYRDHIAAFGDSSVEFFANGGNSVGSPLVRRGTINVGAIKTTNGSPILTAGDTVYWVGKMSPSGSGGIYRFNNFQAEKVSNQTIDKMVDSGQIEYVAGIFGLLGMTHVAFSGNAGLDVVVPCYCIDSGFWWFLDTAGDIATTAVCGAPVASSSSKSFIASISNAKIYSFDPLLPVWQDNSSAYTMTAQTEPMDLGTHRRKYWKRLALVYDVQSAASNVGVSYSDDDYANFSTARNIDTNTVQAHLDSLGSSRRRAWKFTHAANTACRIHAMDIDYEVGAH